MHSEPRRLPGFAFLHSRLSTLATNTSPTGMIMQRWISWLAGTALAAGAAGITFYYLAPRSTAPSSPPAHSTQPLAASVPPSTAPDTTSQAMLPEIREETQRLAFHNAYRSFFSHAAELPETERNAQAQALSAQIDTYEQRGELALSEALLLQVALIRAISDDPEEQKARADALVERYKATSAQRAARDAEVPDARFAQYKAEEKQIVEEVLALDSIPGGMSRDEYLRQRLQEARERAYQ